MSTYLKTDDQGRFRGKLRFAYVDVRPVMFDPGTISKPIPTRIQEVGSISDLVDIIVKQDQKIQYLADIVGIEPKDIDW